MNEIIELKNVHKIYELGKVKINAVAGISLKIRKGDFISIIGPSGSGKSTVMHLIGGLDLPSKGAVFINKKNTALMDDDKLAHLRGRTIGFIFQTFNLINTATAVENVMLPMTFQGISEEEGRVKAIKLLENLGLGHRLNHKPQELSGGEQQRIAISRALANDPNLILADEPTGNLDSNTGNKIINILKDLNDKKGKTLVIVTHDMAVAEQAKRIIKLKDGMIDEN